MRAMSTTATVASRASLAAGLAAALLAAAPVLAGGSEAMPLTLRLAWQTALERVCLSPGIIDGQIGPKTELATREFQRVRGLRITGELDAATASLLAVDAAHVLGRYTIAREDLDEIGPAPAGWLAKSRLDRLAYPSLQELVAERFHCTRGLLATLNAGADLRRLKVGEGVIVPVVAPGAAAAAADRLDVDLAGKVIRAYAGDRLVGLFHCSVAAHREKLPSRPARVAVIVENPTYHFRPEMWPEVKGIDQSLIIPPGPRNPVGVCWIGLSLPGYGMHGSPAPEMIGKTGSHGCFRLTNWDALRLSRMVHVGLPVTFSRR